MKKILPSEKSEFENNPLLDVTLEYEQQTTNFHEELENQLQHHLNQNNLQEFNAYEFIKSKITTKNGKQYCESRIRLRQIT